MFQIRSLAKGKPTMANVHEINEGRVVISTYFQHANEIGDFTQLDLYLNREMARALAEALLQWVDHGMKEHLTSDEPLFNGEI